MRVPLPPLGDFSWFCGKGRSRGTLFSVFPLTFARHKHCGFEPRWRFDPSKRISSRKVEAIMKNSGGLMKLMMVFAVALLATAFVVVSVRARTGADDFDAAGTYKAKCFACHGAKPEKKFNSTLSDDEMVQAIMKGKKPEKPPNMPGFEERGITNDQAKALVTYMKSIK
jgi:mono/diheme cytochrome c family protein